MWSRYTELVLYKTYADLRAEAERTYLGFLWWIFEPVMHMAVFYIFFGILMAQGTKDYVPFLLIGLSAWQWFKSSLSHGADAILGGRFLMQQVHLPKLLFPIILILTDGVKFVFIFALLLLFLWLYGYGVNTAYLALPAVLLVELLLITACTFVLSAVVPFLPDLRFVVESVLQAVFFASGIFFVAEATVPEKYKIYYYLNPMAGLIEDYRAILMHGQWPDWSALTMIGAASLLGIWLGLKIIRHFEYTYPKIS